MFEGIFYHANLWILPWFLFTVNCLEYLVEILIKSQYSSCLIWPSVQSTWVCIGWFVFYVRQTITVRSFLSMLCSQFCRYTILLRVQSFLSSWSQVQVGSCVWPGVFSPASAYRTVLGHVFLSADDLLTLSLIVFIYCWLRVCSC